MIKYMSMQEFTDTKVREPGASIKLYDYNKRMKDKFTRRRVKQGLISLQAIQRKYRDADISLALKSIVKLKQDTFLEILIIKYPASIHKAILFKEDDIKRIIRCLDGEKLTVAMLNDLEFKKKMDRIILEDQKENNTSDISTLTEDEELEKVLSEIEIL